MTRLKINSPDVIAETIAGEALIINLASGAYFSADGVGEAIWRSLIAGRSREEVADELGNLYDASSDTISQAIDTFIEYLLAEGLVTELTGEMPPPAELPATGPVTKAAFSPPVMAKYTDLQELLLLDPIHDVEEKTGWPQARPGV